MSGDPAEILARFGRYEAIEELLSVGKVRWWRARDPYARRPVTLAELVDVDPSEVFECSPRLAEAFLDWSRVRLNAVDILDFDPGGAEGGAFVVLRQHIANGLPAGKQGAGEPDTATSRAAAGLARYPKVVFGVAVTALLAAVVGLYLSWPDSGAESPETARLASVTRGAEDPERGASASAPPTVAQSPTAEASGPLLAGADETAVPEELASPTVTATSGPAATLPGELATFPPPVVSFAPPSGSELRLGGAQSVVSVREPIPDGVAVEWRLEGDLVGTETTQEIAELAVESAADLEAHVFDQDGREIAVGRWRIAIALTPTPGATLTKILASRKQVAPGGSVTFQAPEVAPDLECEWLVEGLPVSRYCESYEWVVPESQKSGEVRIALRARVPGAEWVTRSSLVRVVAPSAKPKLSRPTNRPTRPAALPTPVAPTAPPPPTLRPPVAVQTRAAQRPTPVPKRPTVAAKPPATTSDPRKAIAQYYAAYEKRLRSRERTRNAEFSFKILELEKSGAGWNVVVERRVSVPGQPVSVKPQKLEVVREGAGLVARSAD